MLNKLEQLIKARDLRKDILFALAMLVIFRIVAHIPVPGINAEGLRAFIAQNQILGLLNIFTGSSLENFSLMMLGVGPYITASIIFQLLTMIVPKLEEISKEGEAGHRKINQWTRMLTVPLAALQGYGTLVFLSQGGAVRASGVQGSAGGLLGDLSLFQIIIAIISITAGSMFLMWLGELISERKIGNGISLIIFAGIVASLPQAVIRAWSDLSVDPGRITTYIVFALIALLTIAGVVFITEAQRNIPVTYARRIRGNRMYGGMSTYLPLRVNQAGVIPIIFAISIILFPPLVAQFFVKSSAAFISSFANWVIKIFQNNNFYAALYFILVVAFTYFYTAVIFHPQKIAEHLQKQGGFIPGLRPGNETARYLQVVMHRILLAGSLFLGLIAVLPILITQYGRINLVIGGTSLLIVVSVVIETVKQINSQLVMRDYEGL